jgi:uncharacterized membrane protein
MKICPVCNSSMDDSTLFCTACGSRLPDATPDIQPEVAPPVYATPAPVDYAPTYTPAPVQEPVAPVQEPVAPVQEPVTTVQEPVAPNYAVPGAVPPVVPGQQPFVTTIDPDDHTADFTPEDVSEHKIYALLVYIGGIIGIIPALLIGKDSPYLKFHVQQKMKLMVTSLLVTMVCSVTSFLIIPALLAGVAAIVVFVVNLICFFRTASGKSIEAPIVKDIKLFK